MDVEQLLLGIGLVAASALTSWIALPRGGQVRPFLRSDSAQAYLAVSIIGALGLGVVNIITGLVPG
jgi:hypothetical protein